MHLLLTPYQMRMIRMQRDDIVIEDLSNSSTDTDSDTYTTDPTRKNFLIKKRYAMRK